ncbi:MAG: SPFH domain-containing protein [Acholeplasmatales bacterium]|nr:SPFH domain-containing protein [Acholeplasmatales bacterium]
MKLFTILAGAEVPVIITVVVVAFVVLLVLLFAAGYVKAAPDTAIIISGLGKRKILIGKAGFRIPFLQRLDKLSLRVFQVDIKTDEAIPTSNFINIRVDGVANLKISSDPKLLNLAAESILNMNENDLIAQVQQVLQGNMREIIGTVDIKRLVQDRQGVAQSVKENVVPDMAKMGIEVVNFNIQSFSDDNHVIENLGIDNISQISKDAAIAKANADRDVTIARSLADEAANRSRVEANQKIIEQNTELSLKESSLKQKTDTAKATADAAYAIEEQKRQQEINIAQINADIAKREREVELGQKEVELQERKLQAQINKQAEAEKYAAEQKAEADLFTRQKAAEARKYELEQEAEMQKIKAEAEKVAKEKAAEALKIEAEAKKEAALAEAAGIEAKGKAEADAILAKAEAMKQYGEAATLQLILDSNVLPEIVKAYSEPMAAAMSQIDSITMYGEGNTAKLNEEITKNGTQIFAGLEKATGLDIKSLLAGFLGGKLLNTKAQEQTTVSEKK